MQVTAIKTHKITEKDTDILAVLDRYLPKLKDGMVVAIASKIISITEGRVAPMTKKKDELVREESELYIPASENPYNINLTITRNMLAAGAGIDESNANGKYILWPRDPQSSANLIRKHLRAKHSIRDLGVIITDSRTTPMRWGVTGVVLGYSGFKPLKDYIGTPDIFGRAFQFEKLSIIDTLASAAILVTGEGNEQTPLAMISDVPLVSFVDHDPTPQELEDLAITIDMDLYGQFLKNANWRKGKRKK